MIRCLTALRRWGHRKIRHVVHNPALALPLVWAPCTLVAAAGLWASKHWASTVSTFDPAAIGPVEVPAPSLFFVWIAAGVFIAARRAA